MSGFVTGGIVPALVVAIPSIALARRRPCPPSGLQKPAGRAYRWRGLVRPQLKWLVRPLLLCATLAHAFIGPSQCPPASMNGSFGGFSTWSGQFGGRPITCDVCAWVVDFPMTPGAFVAGRCRVKHFGHRRLLELTLIEQGRGTFCRRKIRHQCCALTVPSVAFDATHPPTEVSGSFACPKKTGTFTLSSAPSP